MRHAGHRLCLGFLLLVSAVPAHAETYRLRYHASLFGLPIGRADFTSILDKNRFEVTGRFASAGIARLFERTDGTVTSKGRLAGSKVVPAAYALDYRSGGKRETTAIRFSGGRIAETVVTPRPKKRGDDWVAVTKADLADAMDPLSALLSPVESAAEVCNRRFKVFDGEMRADIVFSPAGQNEQIRGAAVTCKVRVLPVSGYREGRSTITFLREKARILVAFTPLGAKGHHTPVEALIGTKIGTVHVSGQPVN
ncbi:DUF3108 domain-containing protein [Nitratireductor sp. ZSWI3]|uniref:DUF3108 domain-containing protein n=1 Tax=Nitratireductor sp. ZSWI3 TaxID=2966359 RepID=UPI00214FAFDD|nr:DUF3108 domain-containing protein [Nitratireductor sp. ZSWI3]MCR4265495.1 DUF3108 domain-containing protein [Nitratireductor sp. ZSWI3]